MNVSTQNTKVAFEKIKTDIKDNVLELFGGAKIKITSAVKEGIKIDLIINNASLLKGFKTEVRNMCSSIDSSLMTVTYRLLQREQM